MGIINKLRDYSKIYVYFLIGILVFFTIVSWNNSMKNDYNTILNFADGEIHTLTLKISEVPKVSRDAISFSAEIKSGAKLKNKIHVRIKYGEGLDLSYSDTITLSGPLTIADGAMNPGNFNYREYLKSQGVCAIMYTDITRIKSIENGRFKNFYNIRSALNEQIFKYMPPKEASLVNALVTGSKDELPTDIEEDFKRAGVYHIVAVSGLHLNMFILFLSYLYMRLPFKERLRQITSITINCAGMLFLFMFTGFGVSIARAAVMGIILCTAPFAKREYSAIHALFAAAFVILMAEPYSYADVSFQLSFLATAGIIIAASFIKKHDIQNRKFPFVAQSLIISVFTWIFTFPSTVNAFHSVSLITPISNIIILSVVPILLAFAYIFAVICVIAPAALCNAASYIMIVPAKAVIFLSELFASVPGAYISMSQEGMYFLTAEFIFITTAVLMFRRKRAKRAFALIILIIIANFNFLSYNNNRACEVTFLNVGQGDCAIITTPEGKTVLIDCGSESVESLYEYNVMPYMNYEGINKIDTAFITHYHTDHTSGIVDMIEDNRIKNLMLPDKITSADEKEPAAAIISAAVKANVPITFVSQGDSMSIDDESEITVISPDRRTRANANNASLVLMFECYGRKVLFTGDIEENTQLMILEEDIEADIVKIPHHGGFSVMSDKFADAVNADYAVISCGFKNSYSHPNDKTLESYAYSEIYRTDMNKTIKFIIDKKAVKPEVMSGS